MLIKFNFGIIIILPLFITACGHSSGNIAKIVEERDSLRFEMQKTQRRLANIDTLVSVLNNGLDSIATEENILFINNHNEGVPTKAEVLKKVGTIKEIIDNQKQKISQLEEDLERQRLSEGNEPDSRVHALLAHVKAQLAEKDREIARLKAQLERKDVDIANLRREIGQQSLRIAELNKRTDMQNEALKNQDAMLNQCYMVVGPKEVLERKGIIRKGKIVPEAALDRSKFRKVDIRSFHNMTFQGKKGKVRVLTHMPPNSYTISSNGNGTYSLEILDPTDFWRVSNYLVIQTD